MECFYNLKELYNLRDYCCEFLFGHVEESKNNCQICQETKDFDIVLTTSLINGVLVKNSDILKQICSYDFNVRFLNLKLK